MKLLTLTLIFILSGSSTFAEEGSFLTIRTSVKKEKKYLIKKISKTKIEGVEGNVILIETSGEEKCIIPLKKIIDTPRPSYAGCSYCIEKDSEVEKHYTEMFLNGVNPQVGCDVANGVTSGFNFTGATTIKGESMYMHKGLAFDFAMYSDGPFTAKIKKKSSFEKLLNSVGKILIEGSF